MPGRWILTTTSSPLCRVAKCTWAIEAEAIGVSSNFANSSAGSAPSSSMNSLCTSSGSAGGTESSRLRNSRDSGSPNAPGLEAMIWPNLT